MRTLLASATLLVLLCTCAGYTHAQSHADSLQYGKYNCVALVNVNGAYQYTPKGPLRINSNGTYIFNGFARPEKGTFTVDDKGSLLFKGGFFDGGKAEKIGKSDKFYLDFPANQDKRWTCTWVKERRSK